MSIPRYPAIEKSPVARYLPMLAILLAHLAFFYALQHGLIAKALPIPAKEVMISLIQATASKPQAETAKPAHPVARRLPQLQAMSAAAPADTPNAVQQASGHAMSAPITPQTAVAAASDAGLPSAALVAPLPSPKLVSGVEYIQAPQADYPPLARRMGEEGKVTLRVLVNEKGRAEKVEIQKSSGFNRLDEAARIALMRALFKPYIEDGKPLMMLATATISFNLNS